MEEHGITSSENGSLIPQQEGGARSALLEGPFTVETEHFLGPIDLLLHLVKKNELEIEKISLAYVADQYVACLEKMNGFDLEIAGEYLVIAATLTSIKSSVLLQEPVELEVDDEGNLVDPHEELLLRLKEAAIYTEGASLLSDRPMLGVEVFAPVSKLSDYTPPPDTYREHDPYLLGIAFRKLLEKSGEDELRYQITLDSVSIVDQMMKVLSLLKVSDKPHSFESLVRGTSEGGTLQRAYVVGTFVALLELCKRQVLKVRQEEEEILVSLAALDFEHEDVLTGSLFQSEFDEGPSSGMEQEEVEDDAVNG
ncbi:MAG: segregation/condensation protein A [Bdellovibrionales bacterium]|nr:segregation/condensation protein A [Bdellovibrionales bacterium]